MDPHSRSSPGTSLPAPIRDRPGSRPPAQWLRTGQNRGPCSLLPGDDSEDRSNKISLGREYFGGPCDANARRTALLEMPRRRTIALIGKPSTRCKLRISAQSSTFITPQSLRRGSTYAHRQGVSFHSSSTGLQPILFRSLSLPFFVHLAMLIRRDLHNLCARHAAGRAGVELACVEVSSAQALDDVHDHLSTRAAADCGPLQGEIGDS